MAKVIMRKQLQHTSQAQRQEIEGLQPFSTMLERQKSELAVLLWRAFKGSPDDRGESVEDFEVEVEESLKGAHGQLFMDWSFLYVDHLTGQVLATAMVSLFRGIPLLIYLAVDPEAQGQGLAVIMLNAVTDAMLSSPESDTFQELYLVVVPENDRARKIYDAAGFDVVGSDWDEVLR